MRVQGRQRRGVIVGGVVVALFFLFSPLSHAAPKGTPIIGIGDSVMMGARGELRALGFTRIDAVEGRRPARAAGAIKRRSTTAPMNVVVHLGNNGPFYAEDCERMIAAIEPDIRVFLVTVTVPRKWKKETNDMIRSCARSAPHDNVEVINWHLVATPESGYIYSDGTHLRPEGAKRYAELITEIVNKNNRN
jgi:hypothetical protein